MASLTNIRNALKKTIDKQTKVELTVYDYVEDFGQVPAVIVEPVSSDFDGSMQRGTDTWDFNLYVLTSRAASSRNGQELLDQLVSGSGDNSIRQIIDENENLGLGESTTAHLYMMKAYGGSFEWAKIPHVGAVLKVKVITDGRE